MKVKPLSLVLCLFPCSLAFAAQATVTNALTYTAVLDKVRVSGNEIEPYGLTTNAEMTVALYPDATSAQPLWCRRFAADVVDGRFAVILADDNGLDVSMSELARPAVYGTLGALFAGIKPTDAIWVEASNLCADGKRLPGVASPLPRGKLAAAPYAVVAERAPSARGSFTVRGTATLVGLEALGDFDARVADFGNTVTFKKQANFGAQGLAVTGTVTKTTLSGVGSLVAGEISASDRLEVATLIVTNDATTVLSSSPRGFTPPQSIRVADALTVGTSLEADAVTAGSLTVAGDFTLPKDGVLNWYENGTLSVPGGVYEADDENANLVEVYADDSYQNKTGKDVLMTYTAGVYIGECAGTIDNVNWVKYNKEDSAPDVGIDVTLLIPLKPEERAGVDTALTRYTKELSK